MTSGSYYGNKWNQDKYAFDALTNEEYISQNYQNLKENEWKLKSSYTDNESTDNESTDNESTDNESVNNLSRYIS